MEKSQNKQSESFIFKLALYIERFIWFFSIGLAMVVLLAGYFFILKPQYEKMIARQQELQIYGLEAQERRLALYIKELKYFIGLFDVITDEDKNRLHKLLGARPDNLTLHIQIEKLFQKHNLLFAGLNISGDIKFFSTKADIQEDEGRTRSIIDLSKLLPGGDSNEEELEKFNEEDNQYLNLYYIPISFSLNTDDYYAVKDFLRDLEMRFPLIDVESLTLSVSPGGTASVNLSVKLYYLEKL